MLFPGILLLIGCYSTCTY